MDYYISYSIRSKLSSMYVYNNLRQAELFNWLPNENLLGFPGFQHGHTRSVDKCSTARPIRPLAVKYKYNKIIRIYIHINEGLEWNGAINLVHHIYSIQYVHIFQKA